MRPEFYDIETFERIMSFEESKGRLKEYCYSQETKAMSKTIKDIRQKLRITNGESRESLKQQLEKLNLKYENQKKTEITESYHKIINGKYPIVLKKVEVKGKNAYTVLDMGSFLISKLLTIEIRRQYQLYSANRDEIVEELRVLSDNPMPKILIRTDIQHFYESIPQVKLIEKIDADGYLSALTIRYLRRFFHVYNNLTNNQERIGLPRGLSFSSVLSEIYLQDFDRKVRDIDGVYFYKRYVDDIVLLANPNKITKDNCWKAIKEIAVSLSLNVHENGDKVVRVLLNMDYGEAIKFNYLGYQFRYNSGHTDLLMTDEKVMRYCKTIDCVLKAYSKVASYRTRDKNGKKHTDGLSQMMHRIEALTGNGNLDSRRNFVKTGLYYSNRLLTDFSQLELLDRYLADAINDIERFNPPHNLFNYGDGQVYDEAVKRIKDKIINQYGFKSGFCERRVYRWKDYVVVLKQLQNLYYKAL